MNQLGINTQALPLDTLWNLFQSQPKAVQIAFVKRLQKEDKISGKKDSSATRKAKVTRRAIRYSDAELEELLSGNKPLDSIPEADVSSIISGEAGKILSNLKKWI